MARIRSELIFGTREGFSDLFQIIPIPPQPLTRLHSGLSLLSAVAAPVMWMDAFHFVKFKWPQPMLTNDDDIVIVC